MKRLFIKICFIFAISGLMLTGCDGDSPELVTFLLTIANIGPSYSSSGTFDTPVGESTPSPIGPGQMYQFDIEAVPGDFLSFATMMVQSNDLFYAPDGTGIELFPGGTAVTGSVQSDLYLWDAGTEVNEIPGEGANQAPRQAGPDTGTDENGTVEVVNDGFTYPTVAEVIDVELEVTATGTPTTFRVTITNLSDATTLPITGGSVEVPLAPGAWVVHQSENPLFEDGAAASDDLEDLAEDGDASGFGVTLAAMSGLVSPIAPGVWVLGTVPNRIFTQGQMDYGEGLEAVAEDGDPTNLAASMQGKFGVAASGIFNTPVGGTTGPATTGNAYQIQFTAEQGQLFTFVTMFVQSNDLFFSTTDAGIPLFAGGNPVTGDITNQIRMWDCGTEVNEEPGYGENQPPRQSGTDTGANEDGVVQLIGNVNDGFTYPAVANVLQVTLQTVN